MIAMQQAAGVPPPRAVPPTIDDESLTERQLKMPASTPANVYVPEPVHVLPPDLAHLNGAIPPQQVYVSASMPPLHHAELNGIASQFQGMGFKQEDSIGTDQLTNSGNNSENNNIEETENEGEEYEEEPVKLFVGQVSMKQH